MPTDLDPRLINRVGALATRLDDAMTSAADDHRRAAASHPEALTALLNFADGERPETLRLALGLSQPGIAHLVAKLEHRGLVERRTDPEDRRASRLHLTASGRRLAERMLADRQRAIADIVGRLSAVEQAALMRVVDAILHRGTNSVEVARRTCRTCDAGACEHPLSCPVTAGANRWRDAG